MLTAEYEADKSSGERVQEVDIIFNYIGKLPKQIAKEIANVA